ncbi:HEPN domain-containing protein [Mumia flava]|nr:HEPN domain-containing protein [Mumia flava]
MDKREEKIVDLLMKAADGVTPAPGREPWEHGWRFEEYRRSDRAAITGRDGPVCLVPKALTVWEQALAELWKDRGVRARWSEEERWGLIASLTVAASERDSEKRRPFLAEMVRRFCSAGPAFIAQMVSNVTWPGAPTRVGDVVIGRATEELFAKVEVEARGRAVVGESVRNRWIEAYVTPRVEPLGQEPVVFCFWTVGQEAKAVDEAERQLREIVDIPLLLERDLRAWKIYRRGSVNRPGVRGLSLDRRAVESGLRETTLGLELAAYPVICNGVMSASPVHWYSADPLPLGDLYEQEYLLGAVEHALRDTPVGRRIRLAARWFAEAHYAADTDDSALALGVCLDAMLGGVQPLPGSAMADRVALLHPVPSERRAVRKRYLDFYGIRSSVAHGGRSSKLDHDALTDAFALAHDIAWRVLAFDRAFTPSNDRSVDESFEDLRLGVNHWPASAS